MDYHLFYFRFGVDYENLLTYAIKGGGKFNLEGIQLKDDYTFVTAEDLSLLGLDYYNIEGDILLFTEEYIDLNLMTLTFILNSWNFFLQEFLFFLCRYVKIIYMH